MTKQEIYAFMNSHPVFFLATVDNGLPRVRGMLLFSADEDGILFHTGAIRDLYRQIKENPKAELCFPDVEQTAQVRVSGTLEIVEDNAIKDRIAEHPSRGFVKQMRDSIGREAFYDTFVVIRLRGGKATSWSYENNFGPCEEIPLD